MKRILPSLLIGFLLASPVAFAQAGKVQWAAERPERVQPGTGQGRTVTMTPAVPLDSTKLHELDARLAAYFQTLEAEPVAVKNRESDFLIGNTPEGPLRDHVAWTIYKWYLESPLMGDEGVSVHVADAWILTGRVRARSEIERMNARLFADFNRQSLLGMPAPPLVLSCPAITGEPPAAAAEDRSGAKTIEGRGEPVPPAVDSLRIGGPADRYRILFFYDTECAKCKLEVILLRRLLDDNDWPVDLYAVYTGTDPDAWAGWRANRLRLAAANTRTFHLWDPEVKSDYQRKYGVLRTPRIFLLDRDGLIVGRGLNPAALKQLMDGVMDAEEYEYGGKDSRDFFDRLFATYGDTLSTAGVLSAAKLLQERTLDRGDTSSFKHMEGDLLYWLSSQRGEAFRNGTLPFIQEYVRTRPSVWRTEDDSLRIVGMADMLEDLVSRTPVGSKLPQVPIPGWKRLRHRGGYVIFYTSGCDVCQSELAAADSLLAAKQFSKGRRPLLLRVDVDELLTSRPELADYLFQTFDLSILPYTMQIGRRGRVLRKYLSLTCL